MGIRRLYLEVEDHFTTIPNRFLRDKRLSRRARGLLAEIMSHRDSWHITIESLVQGGTEGRHAIRAAITELVEHGYLVVSQQRADTGKFDEIDYDLHDPDSTAVRFSDSGSSDSGKSPAKKNSFSEEHLQEESNVPDSDFMATHERVQAVVKESEATTEAILSLAAFERAWKMWPKHVDKATARKRWPSAVKKSGMTPDALADIAIRHAAVLRQREPQFIPHFGVWLNKERWEDDLLALAQGSRPTAGGMQSKYLEA